MAFQGFRGELVRRVVEKGWSEKGIQTETFIPDGI